MPSDSKWICRPCHFIVSAVLNVSQDERKWKTKQRELWGFSNYLLPAWHNGSPCLSFTCFTVTLAFSSALSLSLSMYLFLSLSIFSPLPLLLFPFHCSDQYCVIKASDSSFRIRKKKVLLYLYLTPSHSNHISLFYFMSLGLPLPHCLFVALSVSLRCLIILTVL